MTSSASRTPPPFTLDLQPSSPTCEVVVADSFLQLQRLLPSTRMTPSFNSNDFFLQLERLRLQAEYLSRKVEAGEPSTRTSSKLRTSTADLHPSFHHRLATIFTNLRSRCGRLLSSTRVTSSFNSTSSASRTPQPKNRSCGSFNANKLETVNFHSRLASILSPSTCNNLHQLAKSSWLTPSFNSNDFSCKLNTSAERRNLQREQVRNCELSPPTCIHPFTVDMQPSSPTCEVVVADSFLQLERLLPSTRTTSSFNSNDFFFQLERLLLSTRMTSSASRTHPSFHCQLAIIFTDQRSRRGRLLPSTRMTSLQAEHLHLSLSTCNHLHQLAESSWPTPSFNSNDSFLQLERLLPST